MLLEEPKSGTLFCGEGKTVSGWSVQGKGEAMNTTLKIGVGDSLHTEGCAYPPPESYSYTCLLELWQPHLLSLGKGKRLENPLGI